MWPSLASVRRGPVVPPATHPAAPSERIPEHNHHTGWGHGHDTDEGTSSAPDVTERRPYGSVIACRACVRDRSVGRPGALSGTRVTVIQWVAWGTGVAPSPAACLKAHRGHPPSPAVARSLSCHRQAVSRAAAAVPVTGEIAGGAAQRPPDSHPDREKRRCKQTAPQPPETLSMYHERCAE